MTSTKSTFSNIQDFLRDNKFIGSDPALERYQQHNLEDYVKFCCKNSHLIEAYTLSLQYAEDLIVLSVKTDKHINNTDAPKVISILRGANIITENYKSLFFIINDIRNDLVHKMLKDPRIISKISSIDYKKHTSDLLDLIKQTDDFYLQFTKKEMRQLSKSAHVPFTSLQVEKATTFASIISKQAAQEVDIPFDNLDQESWKKKFKEEYFKIFQRKHVALIGREIRSS